MLASISDGFEKLGSGGLKVTSDKTKAQEISEEASFLAAVKMRFSGRRA